MLRNLFIKIKSFYTVIDYNEIMLKKKDKLYYARILPNSFTFDVCELIIRTVNDEWFVGIDKHDKHAYLFSNNEIGERVFYNRDEALNKVKIAESNARGDLIV